MYGYAYVRRLNKLKQTLEYNLFKSNNFFFFCYEGGKQEGEGEKEKSINESETERERDERWDLKKNHLRLHKRVGEKKKF